MSEVSSSPLTAVTSRLSRVASPFEVPPVVTDCLAETTLHVGAEEVFHGEMLTLEPGDVSAAPRLQVRMDEEAATSLTENWALTPDETRLLLLVEAPFLNLLDVEVFDPSTIDPRDGARSTEWGLPEWVVPAIGRTKVTARVLLVLASDSDPSGGDWRPHSKGAILAEWYAQMGVPSLVHWFTPRALTAEARERLNARSKTPVAQRATLYIYCSGLLEPKSLEEALEIYIDEDLAQILNAATPTPAVKAVESQIAFQVLSEMLESVHAEADDDDLTPESAVWPLFQLIGEAIHEEPLVVYERLTGNNWRREILALRTHLQQAAGTSDTSVAAARRGDV